MRVVIIGGGNLGLVCAARMSAFGVDVTILTREPSKWPNYAEAEDFEGRHFKGPISVTSDTSCVSIADLIFFCIPSNVMSAKILQIKTSLREGTPLMSVFSGDGFFFIVEEVLGNSWPAMGLQRVPFIARTKIPFNLGGIKGYKKELFLGYRNIINPESWRKFVEGFCGTKTNLLDNFYDAALINGNVVMHPARLMSLKKQIEMNGPFGRIPLFYEEWDEEASAWAIRIDNDVCAIAAKMGAHIQTFLDYYESSDIQTLTQKIRSIRAFQGIGSPVLANGYLDKESRYYQADVLVAMVKIITLGEKIGVDCSQMKLVYHQLVD